MAESYQYGVDGLAGAVLYFPDLPWKASAAGDAWVWDAKQDAYVPLSEGQYIVHIGDRYEVSDTEPARAKPAEQKVEAPEEEVPAKDALALDLDEEEE